MTVTPPPPPLTLRVHQQESLAALAGAWAAGRRRAWVALPPGAGKTLVGLETIKDRVAAGAVGKAVVLGPNTAIQGQWERSARDLGLDVATDRTLTHAVTALTYQALAVFDPDSEVDDDGQESGEPGTVAPPETMPGAPLVGVGLLTRLHANGQAFVEQLRAAGPLLLVLDECHHLLEVWGRLLGELLDQLPDAMVLGLTATPPEALTADQALLVDELFGAPLYRASIPAVVKVGDLAPYVELAWLTTPTPQENDWLKEEASRFQELITQLTAPAFGSMPFLQWLDARFVATTVPWFNLLKEQPEVCRAVLRLHHAGMLRLPPGARMAEEHRTRPTADDWCLLIEDWLQGHLTRTGKPEDEQVVEAVRRALPSVGYQWTKRGIRRGRSPVDRVLARSESKTAAVVAIVGAEHRNLGEGLRMLVLCDHERAGATLPADLTGVLDQQSGSAHAMLDALVEGAETGPLAPMLVTGKTVAGAPGTLLAFQQWLPGPERLADTLRVEPLAGSTTMSSLVGPWESRDWVGLVTTYFQDGHCKVLVGTRALLGEGWDAKRITGLADVTAVTTITSVVQTRGRALRTDPLWPEKVAVNWSLVCVTDTHPKGGNDWDRLVRKHAGFLGLDVEGQIIDGVAHLDPAFSPFVPPPVSEFEAANARALVRSEQRALIREQWQVGQPYADATVPTIRIKERGQPGQAGFGLGKEAAEVVLRPDAAELRGIREHAVRDRATSLVAGAAVVAGLAAFLTGGIAVLAGAVVVGGLAATARVRSHLSRGRELDQGRGDRAVGRPGRLGGRGRPARRGSHPPGVGLGRGGRRPRGGVPLPAPRRRRDRGRACSSRRSRRPSRRSACRATSCPAGSGRSGSARARSAAGPSAGRRCWPGFGRIRSDGVVYHAVPTVLGVNAERAAAYAKAWDHWVGGGEPVYTGSPEGQGILAANQGTDPFDASTVMRRQWA